MDDGQLLKVMTGLVEGPSDTPLWSGFLESLRHAILADVAILIFDPPGRPMDNGLQLAAGCSPTSLMCEHFRTCIGPSTHRRPLPEGRLSTLDGLFHPNQAASEAAYRALVDEMGIVSARIVRVSEPRGVDGWLIVARRDADFSDADFSDADEAMLSALIRPLRGTLRNYVAAESDRFRSAMAAEAVRRMQCGWFLLDRSGYLLAADPYGEKILATSGVLASNASGRLSVRPAKLEREVLQAVADLANSPVARPRAIPLRSDPWLDMLLVPARKKILSESALPMVIAYVHGDNWHSTDRCSQLSDMFELSNSEARLALALCRGRSITEAATDLGLALETTRSYTKSIYAKTGTRGMADLVRIVMGSVLALAPDA